MRVNFLYVMKKLNLLIKLTLHEITFSFWHKQGVYINKVSIAD